MQQNIVCTICSYSELRLISSKDYIYAFWIKPSSGASTTCCSMSVATTMARPQPSLTIDGLPDELLAHILEYATTYETSARESVGLWEAYGRTCSF